MNVQLRIEALEDQVADLKKALAGQSSQKKKSPLPMNFTYTPPNNAPPILYLTIQVDGSFVVKGEVTTDPTVIGQAMLDFQARLRKCNASREKPHILVPVPKDDPN